MKKVVFAKIFELETHQVVITKEYDDDEFRVKQLTDLNGIMPSISLVFDDEDKCNKCFDEYTKDNAINFIETITKMLES